MRTSSLVEACRPAWRFLFRICPFSDAHVDPDVEALVQLQRQTMAQVERISELIVAHAEARFAFRPAFIPTCCV